MSSIVRFNIRKTQVKLFFITNIIIIYIIMIFIIHFISSLLFYLYNLYCIGFKVMFIVCDILIILFWLIFVDWKLFVHCNKCFDRKKNDMFVSEVYISRRWFIAARVLWSWFRFSGVNILLKSTTFSFLRTF